MPHMICDHKRRIMQVPIARKGATWYKPDVAVHREDGTHCTRVAFIEKREGGLTTTASLDRDLKTQRKKERKAEKAAADAVKRQQEQDEYDKLTTADQAIADSVMEGTA